MTRLLAVAATVGLFFLIAHLIPADEIQPPPNDPQVLVQPTTTTAAPEGAAVTAPLLLPSAVPPTTIVERARTAPTTRKPDVATRSSSDVPDIIRAGFARFGAVVAEQAVRVSSCETGGTFNPEARNGPNVGLMQLNGQFHRERAARLGYSWDQMTDPRANVAVAASLYADEGWRPWACRGAA